MRNRRRVTILGIVLLVILAGAVLGEEKPLEIRKLELRYQNELFSAEIQSATIGEIFEELKKQVGIGYQIEEEIQVKKVTIEIKGKELVQGIKDILNSVGNPSYMISYRKKAGLSPEALAKGEKYEVSRIEIRKTGSSSPSAKSPRDLQPGEMEVGLVDDPKWRYNFGKYRVRAKDVDVNELFNQLESVSGEKIVSVKIERNIDFEGEECVDILVNRIINKLRPKIYKTGPHFAEVDRKGNVIKPGYYEVSRMTDAEIEKRREEAITKNTEMEKLMRQGRYLEAISLEGGYDPDYIEPQLNLGKIYLLNREYSNAIGHFNTALDIDSTNADAWLGLVEAYQKTGQNDKVIEGMEKYIEFCKDDKKISEFRKELGVLREKNVRDYYALLKDGDEYKASHDIEKAKEVYKKALILEPELVFAYDRLGQLYEFEMQDYKDAGEMYIKVIEKDPSNFQAYSNLGRAYLAEGRTNEAIEMFTKSAKACQVKETVLKINQIIEDLKSGIKYGK